MQANRGGALAASLRAARLDGPQEHLRVLVSIATGKDSVYRKLLARVRKARPSGGLAALEGKLLLNIGAAVEAEARLRAARGKAGGWPVATWLGESLLLQGRFEEALAVLESAVSEDRGYRWARFLRAATHLALGRPTQARRDCALFHAGKPDAAAFALRAMVAAAERRWKDAEADLERASALSRGKAWTWTLRACVRRSAGDWSGTRRALEKALRAEPSAALYAELAEAQEALGLWTLAIGNAETAVRLEPTVERHRLKARLHRQWREYDLAIREYTRALALRPVEASLFFERSQARAACGRVEQALSDAEAAVKAGCADRGSLFWRDELRILSGKPGAARGGFLSAYAALRARRYAEARRRLRRCAGLAENEGEKSRASFYLAAATALDQPRVPRPGGRLFLAGLGVNPPYSMTAQCLRALASCDVVFNNVPGVEIDELLLLFARDYRALAYHQEDDEARLADRIMAQVRAGRKVAFVTRGNAIVYGPLGAELLRRCRRGALAWECLPAVSSADALEARFGAGPRRASGSLILDDRALRDGDRIDAGLPLTLYLTVDRSPENFRKLCRRLARIYGAARACVVLDRQIAHEPIRVAAKDLPGLWDRLTAAAILHIPPRGSALMPPREAPARLRFLGLGLDPDLHATLETLQAAAACDRLFCSGLTAAQARRLGAEQPRDDDALARRIIRRLDAGETAGLATLGHPFHWSDVAGRLVSHCRSRRIGWSALPSVSPIGAAIARAGVALGAETMAIQARRCGASVRLEPAWPSVVYFPEAAGADPKILYIPGR